MNGQTLPFQASRGGRRLLAEVLRQSGHRPAAGQPRLRALRRGLLLATHLGVLGSPLAAAAAKSDWNIVDHIALDQVILQSHRGAGFLAEENTLEAFELGWRMRTYPEADVRTTSDGVIVAFHDANFDRVVKNLPPELKGKGVQHVTWAELQKLDVGAWKGDQFTGRRVSRMSDIFAAMRGKPERHLYLDIKSVDLKQLASEVIAAGVERQVVLASPRPEEIAAWKKMVPQSETLHWMRGTDETLGQRIAELRRTNFEGITQLQIHIFPNKPEDLAATGNRFTVSDGFIIALGQELRRRGILFQSLPYTPDPDVYAQLLDLGLMSFSTDYPDVTLRELKAYYDAKQKRR
jgi:glycerophosphoryl diester phosphodiesterase